MSKDPAMMLYTSDFLTGTMLLTNEQVGKYIRLLCYEHQHGRMREKDMIIICLTYDEDIFCKFKKDDAGLYYNCRLEEEQNKRIAYSESRKANRTLKKESYDETVKNTCDTYDKHMDNEIDNEIVIDSSTKLPHHKPKLFTKPSLEEVAAYCKERGNNVNAGKWMDHYISNGWKVGPNPMKDWKGAVRTWEDDKFTKQKPAFAKPKKHNDIIE